jgi:hypothetical protein
MSEQQPAGWYAHPSMVGTQRYWDGEEWTDHIAPAATETPQRAQVTQMQSVVLKVLLLGGAFVFVAFVAWFLDRVFIVS